MTRAVYVVDDEEPIRRALRLMLIVQGYAPTLFSSGPALLEIVDALVPGCFLLDIRMPDMDGIEVQRQLGARRPELPVVMMTGHGDLAIAAAALQNGAVSFIEKPFAKEALKEALGVAFQKLEDPAAYQCRLEAAFESVARLQQEDRAMLEALSTGRSSETIAASLGVGAAVIEVRRARILNELGAASVQEAVRIAISASKALRDST
jgi:two-component system, LuxR family, response regulator FixJ